MSNAAVVEKAVQVPDQTPFVQAGLDYLGKLYNLKSLFSSFNLDNFTIQNAASCVLAQAAQYESNDPNASYYTFMEQHLLPAPPDALGFAVGDTTSRVQVVVATGDALDNAWKTAIQRIIQG